MKNFFFLLLFASSAAYPQGGRLIENPLRKIPRWVRDEFSARHLDEHYSILFRLYPHYLRGDFNGDGRKDVALQVEERSSGKLGIAIFHTKKAQALYVPVTILGAGKAVGKAGDDFKWVEVWSIRHRRSPSTARKATLPAMEGDALNLEQHGLEQHGLEQHRLEQHGLEQHGGRSGFVYWDGKKYSWFPPGR